MDGLFGLAGNASSDPIFITQTWREPNTAFPAPIRMNILNLSSSFSSLLVDLQVNGASVFKLTRSGRVTISGDLFPVTDGGLSIGGSGNGIVSITYTSTGGAIAVGSTAVYRILNGSFGLWSDDSASLGVSGTAWSDLFLASGAVINFASGDFTGTHSIGQLGFNKIIAVGNSAGASLGKVGGCIFDDFASASTTHTDGTFDTVLTHTVAANVLGANGDKIVLEATLTTVAHAISTDQIKAAFGGIEILDSGANNYASAGTIRIRATIIRKTSTTCRATVDFFATGSATILGFDKVQYTSDATLTGMTLSGTNTLTITAAATGTNSASGDVVMVMGQVTAMPAA